MTTNPYAPPTAIVADVDPTVTHGMAPPFFAVSMTKLVVMSIFTTGIYNLFWFYRNWQAIRDRERADIWPAARCIFAVLYVYPLFSRVRDFDALGVTKARLPAGVLSIGYVVVLLSSKLGQLFVAMSMPLPEHFRLVALVAFLFLLPVQARINAINAAVAPRHDRNARFTVWDWLVIAVGSVWLLLVLAGLLLPQASE